MIYSVLSSLSRGYPLLNVRFTTCYSAVRHDTIRYRRLAWVNRILIAVPSSKINWIYDRCIKFFNSNSRRWNTHVHCSILKHNIKFEHTTRIFMVVPTEVGRSLIASSLKIRRCQISRLFNRQLLI